jgi:hypothetical protein
MFLDCPRHASSLSLNFTDFLTPFTGYELHMSSFLTIDYLSLLLGADPSP